MLSELTSDRSRLWGTVSIYLARAEISGNGTFSSGWPKLTFLSLTPRKGDLSMTRLAFAFFVSVLVTVAQAQAPSLPESLKRMGMFQGVWTGKLDSPKGVAEVKMTNRWVEGGRMFESKVIITMKGMPTITETSRFSSDGGLGGTRVHTISTLSNTPRISLASWKSEAKDNKQLFVSKSKVWMFNGKRSVAQMTFEKKSKDKLGIVLFFDEADSLFGKFTGTLGLSGTGLGSGR
jgi:hypothetical protein